MAKDINSDPYVESTQTKLDIFEWYLQSWLPVFILKAKSAAIWDFFAGSGQDLHGEPGSPLRILRQIKLFGDLISKHRRPVRVVFNDNDEEKACALQSVVNQTHGEWSHGGLVTVECLSEDFQLLYRRRYQEMAGQPNLVFIDQYGIKHVNPEIFRMLISLERTDFLFFISSSYVKRFAKTPEFASSLPNLPVERIAEARTDGVHRIMLEYYRQMIPTGHDLRLYPFTLRKAGSGNVYGLVFGSRHPLGVEKFLDLAWKVNHLNGEANFDIDDDQAKAQPELPGLGAGERMTKVQLFQRDLEEFIHRAGTVTNLEVLEFTLARGHLNSHARDCIERLRQDGQVSCQPRIAISFDSCIKHGKIQTIRSTHHG